MSDMTPEAERLLGLLVKVDALGQLAMEGLNPDMEIVQALIAYKASIEPKKARRGSLKCNSPDKSEWCTGIEAIPEVETRCGPTAGVDKDDVHYFVTDETRTDWDKVAAIMQLIADAAPPVEDK